MSKFVDMFHEPQGVAYHGGALLYALGAYVLGWLGLFTEHWWINVPATMLLAHGMVIAAYMIHECGHNTVFRSNRANAVLGECLGWLCGSSYTTFEDIRYKHFRHHMDNDDSVWFMHEVFLRQHPWLARTVQVCEWLYIPAHDVMMHIILVFNSFVVPGRSGQRPRNLMVIAVRGSLFLLVLMFFPRAALLYLVAYLLMIHVLRFMDSLQHDYGGNPILFEENAASRFGGRATEQLHTFSNPLSFEREWVNWLTLNFGWHNAHHARPTVPWYRLPAYHKANFGGSADRIAGFGTQCRIYHKYRMCRVLHEGGDIDGRDSPMQDDYVRSMRAGEIYGGNAVSFLTSF